MSAAGVGDPARCRSGGAEDRRWRRPVPTSDRPARRRGARWLGLVVLLAALGLVASACASADQVGSPRHRVATWTTGTQFGQEVGTILDDAHHIDEAVARHVGTNVVHTVCLVLFQDTETAAGNLPTPDRRLTDLLARAYTAEVTAAHECYQAGATGTSLLRRSAREREQAQRQLDLALARVRTITGTVVPTTTTTLPGAGGIFG